ncbi:MAG: hypothetical protein WD118_04815 [Phycisphaeraceae bacterium]
MSNPDTDTRIIGSTGTNRLRRAGLLASVLGALAAFTAIAGPRLETIEECLETGTDLVALPGTPVGTLSAKECSACATLRLRFDAGTRYYIGTEAVPYTRLRAAASRGTTGIDVFYHPGTLAVTRLRLVAGADATQQ